MSSFPGSPRLLRCALVLIDNDSGAVQRIINLQYNPDTLSRSLQIKGVSGESGDHIEALRLKGPPTETIKLEAEIDATDALANADPQTVALGIHPQLALLESIIYPSSAHLYSNRSDVQSGTLEISPSSGPLTLFVFGPQRIVPVRIQEFSITEEAFDPNLNPLRAKISLGLRVLTIDDLGFDGKGGGLFMAYLQAKEQLAKKSQPGSFSNMGITGIA
ncbi:MAG: hypothetical protein HYZ45_10655 [Burkholderiales bacterium]|nr:hypothetical protein [Burkholderiales bacterium]